MNYTHTQESPISLLDCWRTWKKPSWRQVEHANAIQNGPCWDLDHQATVVSSSTGTLLVKVDLQAIEWWGETVGVHLRLYLPNTWQSNDFLNVFNHKNIIKKGWWELNISVCSFSLTFRKLGINGNDQLPPLWQPSAPSSSSSLSFILSHRLAEKLSGVFCAVSRSTYPCRSAEDPCRVIHSWTQYQPSHTC